MDLQEKICIENFLVFPVNIIVYLKAPLDDRFTDFKKLIQD